MRNRGEVFGMSNSHCDATVTSSVYAIGKRNVDELLSKYRERFDYKVPIVIENLFKLTEELKGIRIELHEDEKERSFEALLIPRYKGFVIKLNKNACSSWPRKRNTYAHELAHVFYYDLSSSFPTKLYDPPEPLCFRLGRQLLVPEDLLQQYISKWYENSSLQSLKKLSEDFQVSLEVMALRLTEDTSLLKDVMFTFWRCRENKGAQMPYKYENFARKVILSPYLKDVLNSYRRNKHVLPAVWDKVLRKVINKCGPFSEEIEIAMGRRAKVKTKIRFRAEANIWGRKQALSERGQLSLGICSEGTKANFISAQTFEFE
ncbi:ImmA/IrrE family metallo-endopeptidase [Dehalococcoidia bacterium]|nr:ImmA/IrrE family metallo-endopeptidase [Dehalococcoidia bacterium]